VSPTKEIIHRLRRENMNWPVEPIQIPKERWPHRMVGEMALRIQVWRSRFFLVQVFDEGGGRLRLSVNRTDCDKFGDYLDGITWDELQALKRQCGYGDRLAVEVYPPDADVVNVANIRHLFVIGAGDTLPAAWWRKS
jgi:hypothetical protein